MRANDALGPCGEPASFGPTARVPPAGRFGWLVAGGILFSVAGDVALLGESDRAFLIGTVAFLIAHLFYIPAFLGASAPAVHFPLPALAVVVSSGALVAALWPRLGQLRLPIVVYAGVITALVLAAFATWGGPLPRRAAIAAAIGSSLFYVSDATVAWKRFRRPFPHFGLVTLGTYWLGQIGIALAARWHG
jgi:alkenylglycerophosphocholine/alkenylglycerophosphoethanolamine hydrolase